MTRILPGGGARECLHGKVRHANNIVGVYLVGFEVGREADPVGRFRVVGFIRIVLVRWIVHGVTVTVTVSGVVGSNQTRELFFFSRLRNRCGLCLKRYTKHLLKLKAY